MTNMWKEYTTGDGDSFFSVFALFFASLCLLLCIESMFFQRFIYPYIIKDLLK